MSETHFLIWPDLVTWPWVTWGWNFCTRCHIQLVAGNEKMAALCASIFAIREKQMGEILPPPVRVLTRHWLGFPDAFHRILSTDRPMSLRCKLLYNHETVDRSTRQSSHLSLLRPKNNYGKRCYIYRASKLHNSTAMQNGLHEMTANRFKSHARMLVQQMWMCKSQNEKINALWYYLYLTKVQ